MNAHECDPELCNVWGINYFNPFTFQETIAESDMANELKEMHF